MSSICAYKHCSNPVVGKYCSQQCLNLAQRLAGYRKAETEAREKYNLELIEPFEIYRNKGKHLYRCLACSAKYRLTRVEIRHSFNGCYDCRVAEVRKKIDNVPPEELSYIAAIIDGEGTIDIVKHRVDNFAARISIPNSNIPLLQYILSTAGFGRIDYGKTQLSRFAISSDIEREAFLTVILPYLKMKQKLAEIILEFPICKTNSREINKPVREKQRELYDKYKTLAADPLYGSHGVVLQGVSPISLAYIAGLAEGEGWFGTSRKRDKKHGDRYYPAVTISNSHKPVMDWVAQVFDKLAIPYVLAPSKGTHKPMYNLQVKDNFAAVKSLCSLILPYMHESSKIEQAKILLDFPELQKGGDPKWVVKTNAETKKRQAKLAEEQKRLKIKHP